MRLFEDFERTDDSYKKEEEGDFAFLARAAGPVWSAVREELERWFASYPEDHASDLSSRLQSPRPDQHWAAWWELYLHRLFELLEFEISVHPEIAASTRRPDFVLRRKETFYIEATTVFSGIVDERRSPQREGWIIDALNNVTSTDFVVSLEFQQVGTERPGVQEITRPVERWLATLDADEAEAAGLGEGRPEQIFAFRDFRVRLRALPRPRERRREPTKRFVGIGPISAGFVDDRYRIGKALVNKKRHHSRLDAPLVIAVLGMSPALDQEDVAQALFGTEAYEMTTGRIVRQPDGLWRTSRGASAIGVSGVLVGSAIQPWSVAQTLPRLWLNPWAEKPLNVRFPFPSAVVEHEQIRFKDAERTPYEVFGLSPDWPGDPSA